MINENWYQSQQSWFSKSGLAVEDWPLVVVKELVDNAIDACEEAGIPIVEIVV